MTIFNLYIFDRNGNCVYYREWKREKQSGMARGEEFKLMFGMLHSLRSFTAKLAPKEGRQTFRSFQTSGYKLNYFEAATGVKFVLNTDAQAPSISMQDLLRQIYVQAYVETLVKNPISPTKVDLAPNTSREIDSELFTARLDDVVHRHPSFT